jgi:hypothetical protein
MSRGSKSVTDLRFDFSPSHRQLSDMLSPATPTKQQPAGEDDDALLLMRMQRSSISDSTPPIAITDPELPHRLNLAQEAQVMFALAVTELR